MLLEITGVSHQAWPTGSFKSKWPHLSSGELSHLATSQVPGSRATYHPVWESLPYCDSQSSQNPEELINVNCDYFKPDTSQGKDLTPPIGLWKTKRLSQMPYAYVYHLQETIQALSLSPFFLVLYIIWTNLILKLADQSQRGERLPETARQPSEIKIAQQPYKEYRYIKACLYIYVYLCS